MASGSSISAACLPAPTAGSFWLISVPMSSRSKRRVAMRTVAGLRWAQTAGQQDAASRHCLLDIHAGQVIGQFYGGKGVSPGSGGLGSPAVLRIERSIRPNHKSRRALQIGQGRHSAITLLPHIGATQLRRQ